MTKEQFEDYFKEINKNKINDNTSKNLEENFPKDKEIYYLIEGPSNNSVDEKMKTYLGGKLVEMHPSQDNVILKFNPYYEKVGRFWKLKNNKNGPLMKIIPLEFFGAMIPKNEKEIKSFFNRINRKERISQNKTSGFNINSKRTSSSKRSENKDQPTKKHH